MAINDRIQRGHQMILSTMDTNPEILWGVGFVSYFDPHCSTQLVLILSILKR